MKRAFCSIVPASAFVVVVATAGVVAAGEPPPQGVPQDPEFAALAFRSAVSAWAYSEYWRLYGMGTRDTRAALSEGDFVAQMEQGGRRPGIGVDVVDVHIRGVHAVVRAKVRMEYGRYARERPGTQPTPAGPTDELFQSVLIFEDGAWRINLYQFVGMARY